MTRNAQHHVGNTVFTLQHYRIRNGASACAAQVIHNFDRGVRRCNYRRSCLLKRHNLPAAGNRILDAFRNYFSTQEHIQRAALDARGRNDWCHFIAMTAQRNRLDITGFNASSNRKRIAKAAGIQRPCHAQNLIARKTSGAQHLGCHFVQRVGNNNGNGVGRIGGNRFAGGLNNAPVDVDQIRARHTRRSGPSSADQDHIGICNCRQSCATRCPATRTRNPRCMVQIQGHRRRQSWCNVD